MASFYGNIKNNSRASFIFDRFYPSRTAMEKALREDRDNNNAVQGDGIFINRYVLINYSYSPQGTYIQVPNDQVQKLDQPINSNIKVTTSNYASFYIKNGEKYEAANKFYEASWLEAGNHYYQKTNFVNRWEDGYVENQFYKDNREQDQRNYHAEYDLTVWMKIYTDNIERYIMVGRLDIDAPGIELIVDAPIDNDYNGGPHFDLLQSSDSNYVYHMPKNWDFMLNEYDPNKEETYITEEEQPGQDIDGYWNYEYDHKDSRTYEIDHEYPYYNEAGFNPKKQSYVENEDKITLENTKSGRNYPNHRYQEISLTVNSYRKNWYYIKENDDYIIATGDFNPNQIYYIKTSEDSGDEYTEVSLTIDTYRRNYYYIQRDNGYIKSADPFNAEEHYYSKNSESPQLDTKRLDISLPSIGNAISDVYDSIYGKPAIDGLLGYTDSVSAAGYNSEETEDANNECKISDPETGDTKFLTEEDIDNLYHDDTYPHTIPVYDVSGDRRPFTEEQLFDATNIDPYDNIQPNDPISMAWGVYEIKKYLSELRFLAEGEGVIGYTKSELIPTYTENNDSGIYKIIDKYYSLTQEQIDALQPFDEANGFTIPVRKSRGIQADWTLDDNKAFGYIFHKPRILWSKEGLEESEDEPVLEDQTDYYAKYSIEYIYDNYKEKTLEELFGTARNTPEWLNNSI